MKTGQSLPAICGFLLPCLSFSTFLKVIFHSSLFHRFLFLSGLFPLPFLPPCSFALCFSFLLPHLNLPNSLPRHSQLFLPWHISDLCPSPDACQWPQHRNPPRASVLSLTGNGEQETASASWTLPTPWFQLCGESCCRWYKGNLADSPL